MSCSSSRSSRLHYSNTSRNDRTLCESLEGERDSKQPTPKTQRKCAVTPNSRAQNLPTRAPSPCSTNNPSKSTKQKPLLIISIEVSKNMTDEISIFQDSKTKDLAKDFCRRNNLKPSLEPAIERAIQEQICSNLGRVMKMARSSRNIDGEPSVCETSILNCTSPRTEAKGLFVQSFSTNSHSSAERNNFIRRTIAREVSPEVEICKQKIDGSRNKWVIY
jgi:hypothetical protein